MAGVDRIALMAYLSDPFSDPPVYVMNIFRFIMTNRFLRGLGKLIKPKVTPDGDILLPRGDIRINRDPENEPVFKLVDKYPDRILGWIFVNPNGERDQVEEFERWADSPGFIGVKAHPFWHYYPIVKLAPIAKRLKEMGKPLLLHVGYDENGDYDALLNDVPDLKLILAHAGFPLFRDTWKKIRNKENIFVDLSQTSYVSEGMIQRVVEYLGVDRCIFGTDGPHGLIGKDGAFDYGLIKRRIEGIFPDIGIQRRLLGDNFAEIIGI